MVAFGLSRFVVGLRKSDFLWRVSFFLLKTGLNTNIKIYFLFIVRFYG